MNGHEGKVRALKVEGNTLVSGGEDGTLRLWDLETGDAMATVLRIFYASSIKTGRSNKRKGIV